jgi:hypothetical protein
VRASAGATAQADGARGHHEGVAHDDKGHDVEPASHASHEHWWSSWPWSSWPWAPCAAQRFWPSKVMKNRRQE